MAASPMLVDGPNTQPPEKWNSMDSQTSHPQAPATNGNDHPNGNGTAHLPEEPHVAQQPEDVTTSVRGSAQPENGTPAPPKSDVSHRGEKQIKVLVNSCFLTDAAPVFST